MTIFFFLSLFAWPILDYIISNNTPVIVAYFQVFPSHLSPYHSYYVLPVMFSYGFNYDLVPKPLSQGEVLPG